VQLLAQTVEIAPLAGYRFGGDLFEIAANRRLDLDGAPVLGAAVNVDMWNGLSFEALFTRQEAQLGTPVAFGPPVGQVFVEHWLAGGRQEFGTARVRPYLTGLLGLTRFGAEDDNEFRFAVGAGGGVKLPIQRRLALRLDSRVFTTFVDVEGNAAACAPGVCLFNLDVDVAWQMEFAVNAVVVF
jgi:hypothetical protein